MWIPWRIPSSPFVGRFSREWLVRCLCLLCLCYFLVSMVPPPYITHRIALLIIDVQNCFMPDQPLGAPHADRVPHVINYIRDNYEERFVLVALVQDWHCANDVGFASQYPGKRPYDKVTLGYNRKGKLCREHNVTQSYASPRCRVRSRLEQILWPDHCVAGTVDAQFAENLTVRDTDIIVRKEGMCQLDTYSAFQYKGGFVTTRLHDILQTNAIEVVFLTGLVLEFGIYYSAMDAIKLGYDTYLVIDAIGNSGSVLSTDPALHELESRGANIIESGDLGIIFENLFTNHSLLNCQQAAAPLTQWPVLTVTVLTASVMTHWLGRYHPPV